MSPLSKKKLYSLLVSVCKKYSGSLACLWIEDHAADFIKLYLGVFFYTHSYNPTSGLPSPLLSKPVTLILIFKNPFVPVVPN